MEHGKIEIEAETCFESVGSLGRVLNGCGQAKARQTWQRAAGQLDSGDPRKGWGRDVLPLEKAARIGFRQCFSDEFGITFI
jgi:hypothetical protein